MQEIYILQYCDTCGFNPAAAETVKDYRQTIWQKEWVFARQWLPATWLGGAEGLHHGYFDGFFVGLIWRWR